MDQMAISTLLKQIREYQDDLMARMKKGLSVQDVSLHDLAVAFAILNDQARIMERDLGLIVDSEVDTDED